MNIAWDYRGLKVYKESISEDTELKPLRGARAVKNIISFYAFIS